MDEESAPGEGMDRLLDRLRLEGDEPAVFSLALLEDSGRWQLIAGSVLFGDPRMSSVAWTDWVVEETGHPHFTDVWGIHTGHPAELAIDRAPWRLVRFAMPQRVALNLLRRWADTGALDDGAGLGEHVHAQLGPPGAPGLISSGSAGPASWLCASASRPVTGWVHPLDGAKVAPPEDWKVDPDRPPCDAPQLLLGFASSSHRPHGLLVGRLARTAWLADIRAVPPRHDELTVTIAFDSERQSMWDLVLDLEETDRDGLLLAARRLRLADLQLPPAGEGRYDVTIPSAGKGLTRNVRLYGLDGRLLDAYDNLAILEKIVLSISVEGDQGPPTVAEVGDSQLPPFTMRLDDLDRGDHAYAELLRAGLANRVILNRSGGTKVMSHRLAAARDELRILDPYFGASGTAWNALEDVTVPIRVLTAVDKFHPPPPGVAPRAPQITIRQLPRRPSLFHDRSYTWSGGGVSVGASANGLDGNALYLIEAMDPVLVADLTGHFDTWWPSAAALWHRP